MIKIYIIQIPPFSSYSKMDHLALLFISENKPYSAPMATSPDCTPRPPPISLSPQRVGRTIEVKQWFSNFLDSGPLYPLKSNSGPQKAFIYVDSTYKYILCYKLTLRQLKHFVLIYLKIILINHYIFK